jgi:hypothetical protein
VLEVGVEEESRSSFDEGKSKPLAVYDSGSE